MGEFNSIIHTLTKAKDNTKTNFEEMDFKNCDLRDDMEQQVTEIIRICDEMIAYCIEKEKRLW